LQRNAAQATTGMPTASRLNAGLMGFNLFQLILLPFHADAHTKWGFMCVVTPPPDTNMAVSAA